LEYLKDSPKFLSITKALQTNPFIRSKKKGQDPELVTLFSPEGTSGSDEAANGRTPRPIGNKAAKRKVGEEKIIDNVTSKLKEGAGLWWY
jgi:hypothetical protein